MLKTKKYIKNLAVVAMSGLLLGSVGVLANETNNAKAAVVGQVAYTDTFDSEKGVLSEQWSEFGGAAVKADYNALRFNSENYEWNSHVVNGKYKLEYDKIATSCTVELVMKEVDENGDWFAFSYGTEDVTYDFPYASGALVFTRAKLSQLFASSSGVLAGTKDCNFDIFHGKKVKVAITFEKTAENKKYNVSAACYDAESGDKLSVYNFSEELGSVRIEDGFFGFNTSRTRMDIFEFNVYEDGNEQPAFSDNFTTPAISYALDSIDNPTWYASSIWNKQNLISGTIGKLDITATGSGAVYVDPVEKDESNQLYLLYSMSADFYVETMGYADSGFIVGADENGNGGTFVGLRKESGNARVVSYTLGNESEAEFGTEYYSDAVIGSRVKVYYDNSVEIAIGKDKYVFFADKTDGYFGVKTYACGDGEHSGAYVDDFEYSNNQYVNRTADDAKVNFDDTIGTDIMGMTVYDYYCPTSAWYKANGLTFPIVVGDNGSLIFSNAGDYQCFAPKKKFNNFIVRFDVTFDNVKNGSTFGIQVGKNDISESSSNSVYVGFQNQSEQTYYVTNKCVSESGLSRDIVTSQSGVAENFFVQGETYNFMAIVENGTIKLFAKNVNEDESILAYERARFVDVPTDGYVAMFAHTVSLRMDNFSITNLDYEYFGGEAKENETFRYDFTQGTSAQDFAAVTGGTFKKDKTIEIVRGTDGLSTVGKFGANITRIRFANVEASASYKHGNITVSLDEANGRLVVSDGATEHAIALEENFVYQNALLQVEETLGKVAVSIVSGDKPIAAIMGSVYEFTVNNTLTATEISIVTPYLASVKELSVFNLDSKVEIESQIYVPQNVRTEKPALQDGEKGCAGSLSGGAHAFIVLGGLAVTALKKKRGKDNV